MRKGRILLYFVIVIASFFINFYFRPVKGNKYITDEYKQSNAFINELYKSDEYFKKKLLDSDHYYIYDSIIKASLEDEEEVSIPCESDCVNMMHLSYEALYLDHPELISFLGSKSFRVSGNKITYHNYENLGKMRTFFATHRIEREMENIRNDVKNMSDKEKIIYVYDYVASHDYDQLFTYNGSNQSAYSFFSKGSSVCAGFAKASQIIFQNIGISSYLVMSEDHMWNYVQYEGKYYVFDATMGASLTNKKHEWFYRGLGETTIEETTGLFQELYPKIEDKKLMDIFGL